MSEAFRSGIPYDGENLVFVEIDFTVLKILIGDESIEKINELLYLKTRKNIIRKGPKYYILTILKRAIDRIEIKININKNELDISIYKECMVKIQYVISYVVNVTEESQIL